MDRQGPEEAGWRQIAGLTIKDILDGKRVDSSAGGHTNVTFKKAPKAKTERKSGKLAFDDAEE